MGELISIVVPVYNAEAYLPGTIRSVQRQTYPDWELLLVNDASTDRSLTIMEEAAAEDARIRVYSMQEGYGAASARNTGVHEARGRYVAFLDADDLWSPYKLEKQLEFMKEQGAAFSYTGYEFADANGVGTGRVVNVPATLSYRQALGNTTIFTSTVMFDTNAVAKELIQMPQVRSEDTATWWKVLRSGHLAYGLNENLVMYRRTSTSLSANKVSAIKRIWKLYRDVEGLGLFKSMYYFVLWAVRATARRI